MRSRRLEIGNDLAFDVLRWHSSVSAMLGLFRNILTDEPQAVPRTFLDVDGRKIERKFLGHVGGAAIRLDADDAVKRRTEPVGLSTG
jgi:hypothetical protein